MRHQWLIPCTMLLAALANFGIARSASTQPWAQESPYHEDDAWNAMSQWFDANDYEPTGQVFARWGDEPHDPSEDHGTNQENDWGFYADNDETDDWFYDYYDYDYHYGGYDEGLTNTPLNDDFYRDITRYYDFDDDGLYDAYTEYHDWDGDGFYEHVSFISLNDVGAEEVNTKKSEVDAQKKASRRSRAYTVRGTIQEIKFADVRDTRHTVLLVKQDDLDRHVVVDLGPRKRLQNFKLEQDRNITVRGPMVQIGDKPMLAAQTIRMYGRSIAIDRDHRGRSGRVVDTQKVEVRGHQHLMTIIENQENPDKKMAIDLGRASQLNLDLNKGDEITVKGFPIKAKDQAMLLACKLIHEGESVEICRTTSEKPGDQKNSTAGQ